MSINMTALQQKIANAADKMKLRSARGALSQTVQRAVVDTLKEWGAATIPQGAGRFGLESLGEVVPVRNQNFSAGDDADPEILMTQLRKMRMDPRHIEQVTESCILALESNPAEILRTGHQVTGAHAPLSTVVGRSAASMMSKADEGVGLEAFGDDINRLASDDRLTMDLIIMRPYDNIMDKALARVNDSSPIVTIKIPNPEVWDWAKTQEVNSTIETRNKSTKLRDLFRDPSYVNSDAKPIVAVAANDVNSVLWNGTTKYYKPAKDVSLLDLSRDSARFSYDKIDRTDLIADGGSIDSVIVKVVKTGTGAATEYFSLNTRPFDLSRFIPNPSSRSAGDRIANLDCTLPIGVQSTQYNGSASTIAALFPDATVKVKLTVNGRLNIQTGRFMASGTAQAELVATGASISQSTQDAFATMTFSLDAVSVDLKFDEENQRKANIAVWVQYYQQQFVVPRSRIYFTEYALTQEVDEYAVATTSSVVALGNGRRGLDIIVNALNDVADGLTYATQYPAVASANSIDEQGFAASLVKPTIVSSSLDFGTDELNVMNESTRLTEIHGRFRARFLAMATMLFAKSLMLNQYKGGEKPVIKAWTHSTIADVVIGILDYHPDLKDEAAIATGADYSMVLPNGYRLDVIKSNLDCLQGRIYAVPVIESDMASILSAASIRDCGSVTTNYTPTNGGAVVRRVATTTREIVMMSNRVGMMLEVKGLTTQLGAMGFSKFALNANRSESIAM